jgi:hypothetical protein
VRYHLANVAGLDEEGAGGSIGAVRRTHPMRTVLLLAFKEVLTRVGARVPERALHQTQMVVNYMKLGRWMTTRGYELPHRLRDRQAVFDVVAERVKDRRVLYLEFGVFKGASMRYWSKALKNAGAVLHGFDSFEGLPQDFDVAGPYVKGTFATGGSIPCIDDPRVKFFKGWFEETLPEYQLPDHEVLILCMDADLYSSTIFVLRHLRPWITRGTYIYFDEMSRPDHEPRAFDEFMKETGLSFAPVAADRSLNTVFFKCLA